MTIVSTTTSPIDNNNPPTYLDPCQPATGRSLKLVLIPIHTPGQKFLATDHFERHRSDNPHRHSDRRPPGERVININRSSNSLEIHVDINHVTRGQHEHV